MPKRPRSDGGSSSGPEDDPDDEPAASQDFPAGMGPGLEEEDDGEDLIGDDMGADGWMDWQQEVRALLGGCCNTCLSCLALLA